MHSFFSFGASAPSVKQPVVLGMDGGGTKTEILVADLEGKIIASHVGGPTNLAAVPESEALDNLEATMSAVFQNLRHVDVQCAVVGMAGVDTPSDETRFHYVADSVFASFGIENYTLLNDSAVALANGSTSPDAIILIAGTGSICFGHNAKGETARAGGMDYLLADEGSGYWIGRKVLRAVVRANDGRGPATALTPLVLEHFKIKQVHELKQKVYEQQLSKMGVAQLAMVWEAALLQNDQIALHIQEQILDKLLALVGAVARSLSFSQGPFDLVLAGSITQLPVVEPHLRARLKDAYPHIQIVVPQTTPAHGAIALALKNVQKE